MTRVNQGLFSTTMEAEKRDPGNEVEVRQDTHVRSQSLMIVQVSTEVKLRRMGLVLGWETAAKSQ